MTGKTVILGFWRVLLQKLYVNNLRKINKAVQDLRYLWTTRKESGFPWPTWRGFGSGWHMVLTGYPSWVAIPLWKQIITIPLRPWRYMRKVRTIAAVRAIHYHPTDYDNVP